MAKRRNNNQFLLILIAVLVVILVAVVIVAVVTNPGEEQPSGTGSTDTQPTETEPLAPLVITQPVQQTFVTLESGLVFQGTADPRETLTIAGQAVQVAQDGTFTYTVQLADGKNEIAVSYMGTTQTYNAEYRYAVQNFLPGEKDMTYNSGATIQVELFARKGSNVTVTLDGKTIAMKEDPNQVGSGIAEGFVRYTGTYKLPGNNDTELQLGRITYTVTCDGKQETYESGLITCKKMADVLASDPSVTPDYGNYMDVGSGYIVEIITYSAETFDGHTNDDYSDPRNNYLPAGTVDYAKQDPLNANNMQYMVLRCGRRVYVQKHNWPSSKKVQIVDCYRGTLPDHNEIGYAGLNQTENHTYLVFDCLWKAPFFFDMGPQAYKNPDDRDFRVTDVTIEYVDITFCYATEFTGTVAIPENNPLFSRAEFTQNESDCTLRLYLKKAGNFFGWDAYYNEQGQLCFRFLNPAKATASAANPYGADLTGVRIMLDVGHGGVDGGAPTTLPDGTEIDEAELNLRLAKILRTKLESMGATVIMNRLGDTPLNVDERIQLLIQEAPDLCIAIHQNSAPGYPRNNGIQVLYFTPYSQPAAQLVYDNTLDAAVYNKHTLDWHVYFVARTSTCPVVLTENGFMSNTNDLNAMLDEAALDKKAEAMAKAAAQYFLQIQ